MLHTQKVKKEKRKKKRKKKKNAWQCCHKIQTYKKVEKNAIYYDNAQYANFQDKPPILSYKTTLKRQLNGEKRDVGYLSAFGWADLLRFLFVFVFGQILP